VLLVFLRDWGSTLILPSVRRAIEEHGGEDEIGEQVHVYTVVLSLYSCWDIGLRRDDTVGVYVEFGR
jgi:hypothetical protein